MTTGKRHIMKPQALAGIRVLDLTQIYQGPYATFMMAMAGAEVIKIEPPGGERTRRGGGENTPLAFAMLNSNKKSLTLDLKKPAAKELLLTMIETADLICENFAPGTMERLGLGWEVLRAHNPRLIYGAANGYGSFGPDWDQLAMDHTIQAASGIQGRRAGLRFYGRHSLLRRADDSLAGARAHRRRHAGGKRHD
jgi:CoA:oxalate CoA-transferase